MPDRKVIVVSGTDQGLLVRIPREVDFNSAKGLAHDAGTVDALFGHAAPDVFRSDYLHRRGYAARR